MTDTLNTKLEIKSWDEKPYRELPDGRKFAKAEVALAGTGDGLVSGTMDSILYYAADGTGTFHTLLRLEGEIGGRAGEVVLSGEGTYDKTTARMTLSIVDSLGDLKGISGTAESASTHEDYPFMPLTLKYDLG